VIMNWKDVKSSGRVLLYSLEEPMETTKSYDGRRYLQYEAGELNTGEWHKWTTRTDTTKLTADTLHIIGTCRVVIPCKNSAADLHCNSKYNKLRNVRVV
jgi:hypothetical protein